MSENNHEELFKTTLMGGFDKDDVMTKVQNLKDQAYAAQKKLEAKIEEKEQEIEEREQSLKEKENRLYAIKAIKSAGLDDGSDKALALVDFVLGDDETGIDEKVKAFSDLVKRFVKAEVDKTFKANGREPEKGGTGNGEKNPYAEGSYNLTEQMRLEVENPELAKTLKTAAGK